MGFLTALLTGLGGFGQGRQIRTQNQQTQEQIDQQKQFQNSELSLEQQRAQRENDIYQRQIAPLQPLPQNLTQIRPNNKGKGGAGTDQDLINHLYAVANFYAGQPSTEAQNLANVALGRASALESILKQNQALNVRTMLDYYNQGQQNQRTGDTIAGALQRTGVTQGGADERSQNMIQALILRTLMNNQQSNTNNQRSTDTSRANTSANISERLTAQSNNDMRQYEHLNQQAVQAYLKANPGADPAQAPVPYKNLDKFKGGLSKAISTVSQDPSQLPKMLKFIDEVSSSYDPALIIYARRQLQDAAAAAKQGQQSAQSGGSQDNLNPPPSPWP